MSEARQRLADPVEATEQALDQLGDDPGTGTLAVLNKSEINQQIATARQYPRSVARFRKEAMGLVSMTESIAEECVYALPRDGKVIEGPSIRFAEILQSCWGNCRSAGRVVDEGAQFVVSQGLFHDLQTNSAITFEVRRRIIDKRGRRYGADMIGVTSNAASSIAMRNAILRGVPKALWADIYETARATIRGDFKTLKNRRADAIAAFQAYGVSAEQIFRKLELRGIEDITLDHLVLLSGMRTAIKDGEITPEDMFAEEGATPAIANGAATAGDGAAATKAEKPADASTSAQQSTAATAAPAKPATANGASPPSSLAPPAAEEARSSTSTPSSAPTPPKVPLAGVAGLPDLFPTEE